MFTIQGKAQNYAWGKKGSESTVAKLLQNNIEVPVSRSKTKEFLAILKSI